MTELPTTEWMTDFDDANALAHAPVYSRWRRVPGVVTHVFTHFPLELVVYATKLGPETPPPAGMRFVALDCLHEQALPNVMRKVVALAISELGEAALRPASFRRAAGRATRRSK